MDGPIYYFKEFNALSDEEVYGTSFFTSTL